MHAQPRHQEQKGEHEESACNGEWPMAGSRHIQDVTLDNDLVRTGCRHPADNSPDTEPEDRKKAVDEVADLGDRTKREGQES